MSDSIIKFQYYDFTTTTEYEFNLAVDTSFKLKPQIGYPHADYYSGEDIEKLCVILERALKLRTLELNEVGVIGLDLLSNSLRVAKCLLTTLDIRIAHRNFYDADNFPAFAAALKHNTTIKRLIIDWPPEQYKLLHELLTDNSTIKQLSIINGFYVNQATERFNVAELLQHVSRNRSIIILSLDINSETYTSVFDFNDESKYNIKLPKLLYLELCNIPRSILNLLTRANPKLQISHNENKLVLPQLTFDEKSMRIEKLLVASTVVIPCYKCVILGHSNAGKTTLLDALMKHSRLFLFNKGVDTQIKSTISLDIHAHNLGSKDVNFRFFDFAGQIEYVTSHKLFFGCNTDVASAWTNNFFILLCVDASIDLNRQESHLQYWTTFLISQLQLYYSSSFTELQLFLVATKTSNKVIDNIEDVMVASFKQAISNCNNIHLILPNSNKRDPTKKIHIRLNVISTDSFTQIGIKKLKQDLLQKARIMNSKRQLVPPLFKQVFELVCQLVGSLQPKDRFISAQKLISTLVNVAPDLADFTVATVVIEFLSAVGIISICAEHNAPLTADTIICLDPVLLAKIAGALLCSNNHLQRLFSVQHDSSISYLHQTDALTEADLTIRINAILHISEDKSTCTTSIIKFLEKLDILFSLDSEAASKYFETCATVGTVYIIPALRPYFDLNLTKYILQDLVPSTSSYNISCAAIVGTTILLSQATFNLLQMKLHKQNLHNTKYKVYRNMMVVGMKQHTGVVFWTDQAELIVITIGHKGENTQLFLRSIVNYLHCIMFDGAIMSGVTTYNESNFFDVSPLCPYHCLFASRFVKLTKTSQENSSASKQVQFQCSCSNTKFSLENLNFGLQVSVSYKGSLDSSKYSLFAPIHNANFFTAVENAKKWQFYSQANSDKPSHLRYVELDSSCTIRELRDEYLKIRHLFYKFIGNEVEEHNFEMTKVIFLHNPILEEQLEATISKFAINAATSYYPSTADKTVACSKDEMWRKVLRSTFNKSISKITNTENVNLLLTWHGTSEAACFGIGNSNFKAPDPLEKADLDLLSKPNGLNKVIQKHMAISPNISDLGYFGRGIYFTDFPNYGEEYANKQYFNSNNEVDGTAEHPLLLNYTLLGRYYPVIEHPICDSPNLHGANCKEGFHSHYTIINSQGYPCKLLDAEKPKANEFVIFNTAQVLPRYIVYFKRFKKPSTDSKNSTNNTNNSSSSNNELMLPAGLQNKQCSIPNLQDKEITLKQRIIILWVHTPRNSSLKFIQTLVKQTTLIHSVTSNIEANNWISNNKSTLSSLINNKRFKVVTDAYREIDSAEKAPSLLLNLCRNHFNNIAVPFLVYSGTFIIYNNFILSGITNSSIQHLEDIRSANHLRNNKANVFATNNADAMIQFISRIK